MSPHAGYTRWSLWGAVLPPMSLCALGVALWWRYGFGPLNEFELPLARFINGLTGRREAFDWWVILLNNWWGEALCVVIIFAAYAAVARWALPKPVDWRRVLMFAGYIFAVWVVVNTIGDKVLEEYVPRDSPSLLMGDGFINLEERYETSVKTEARTSMPSNHGSVFFTVFFVSLMRFGRKVWVLLPLVIVLSSPRAFTGAHWMSDSLIGSALVAWTVAAVAVRTPIYRIHQRIEDGVCRWWDQRLLGR